MAFGCFNCSVAKGRLMMVNTAPRNEVGSQGCDHLTGQSHQKIVGRQTTEVWSRDNLEWFFQLIADETGEAYHVGAVPMDSYAEYIAAIGGDAQRAIEFCLPPPPMPPKTV